MTNQHTALLSILIDVEYELRRMNLWEFEEPSPEALMSSQPFAVDTLSFTQWVQFIFIRRLRYLVDNELALPAVSGIAPMAEQSLTGMTADAAQLIAYLDQIDVLLSGKSSR